MKKVLVLCLAIVMLFSCCMTVFAAPNGFVKSPSSQPGPGLVDGDGVVITPYEDRDKLDDETRKEFEEAYDSIISADNLAELNEALKKLAEELGIDVEDLAVSDLFDVGFDSDGEKQITLKPETLENFVALLRWDGEKWILIEDATAKNNLLSFTLDNPGQLAVVVNTGVGSVGAPVTGDAFPWILVGLIAISGIGLAIVLPKLRKKEVQ